MKEVSLRLTPICECGYIFDELKCSEKIIDNNGVLTKKVEFEPLRCPKCGGYIKDIRYHIPINGVVDYSIK